MSFDLSRLAPGRAASSRTAGPVPDLFPGRRMLTRHLDWRPTLLVVVDTEEEFDWSAPPDRNSRAVTNVALIPLLQQVFDRHGVAPAYLLDQPVVECPRAVALLGAIARRGACEIGAHLHPWLTPPLDETLDLWHGYGGNLPPELEWRKLQTLTTAITEAFGPPRIFKAGAYGIGPRTPGFLARLGYTVDSSVVPYTDFSGAGGPNFQDLTGQPFTTAEGIVEIPLTAGFAGRLAPRGRTMFPRLRRTPYRQLRLPGIAARLRLLERLRLSPEGHALGDMVRLTEAALARGERLFMLALHSSSLLPGATSYVPTLAEREAFLRRLDAYLSYFATTVGGHFEQVSAAATTLAEPEAAAA